MGILSTAPNLDTISVGGEALFRRNIGPLLSGTEHVPPLDQAVRFFGDDGRAFERLADYIDYVLGLEGDRRRRGRRTDALDDRGAATARLLAARPGRAATAMARFSVFDEIPSCLGRTGTMFASEQVGAVPDILVIGKGLGGGNHADGGDRRARRSRTSRRNQRSAIILTRRARSERWLRWRRST
ncbi:MAG: aminotransferase class III-fold pyridoxal phosphate-dependent enzyme [Bauldia sp.]